MSRYIYDTIHKSFWKPKSIGYTNDISEAGLYSDEYARNMSRDANINGKIHIINITEDEYWMIEKGILPALPTSPPVKKDLNEVLESMGNTNSLNSNPISLLFETLEKNEYYPIEDHDHLRDYGQPINYGETFQVNLKIQGEYDKSRNEKYVNVSIYRKDNGLYEMTCYSSSMPKKKQTSKNKNKP